MKTVFSIILSLVFVFCVFSQSPPVKYGKISAEDFVINSPLTENADAIVLFDYGKYYFDAKLDLVFFYYKRHIRIKILNENGLKYAKQQVNYFDLVAGLNVNINKTYLLKAQTLNLGKTGKIEKVRVRQKNIIKYPTDIDFNTSIDINFQKVKVGSIIEYEITLPTLDMMSPKRWYFQREIPVLWSEFQLIAPKSFNYAINYYNTVFFDAEEITNETKVIGYKRGSISYHANIYRYAEKNIPPLIKTEVESYYNIKRIFLIPLLLYADKDVALPAMDEMIKSVNPDYKYFDKAEKKSAIINPGHIIYKQPKLEYLPRKMSNTSQFSIPLLANMGLNDTIKAITSNCTSDKEKVETIYNFVKNRMTWNNKYRIFVNHALPISIVNVLSKIANENTSLNISLRKPYNNKTGSSSEINYILINLLRFNGFDANPLFISTLNHNIIDPNYISFHQFNHVVVHVQLDNEVMILDAVKKSGGSILSQDFINKLGLKIGLNDAEWIAF